jgi:hypothetical protein
MKVGVPLEMPNGSRMKVDVVPSMEAMTLPDSTVILKSCHVVVLTKSVPKE